MRQPAAIGFTRFPHSQFPLSGMVSIDCWQPESALGNRRTRRRLSKADSHSSQGNCEVTDTAREMFLEHLAHSI